MGKSPAKKSPAKRPEVSHAVVKKNLFVKKPKEVRDSANNILPDCPHKLKAIILKEREKFSAQNAYRARE